MCLEIIKTQIQNRAYCGAEMGRQEAEWAQGGCWVTQPNPSCLTSYKNFWVTYVKLLI